MARRPARDVDDDQDDDTPPWMERDRAPSRRAATRADRDAEPTHTVVTWRALIIGAVLAIGAAIAGVLGVRSLISREPAAIAGAAPGEAPLIRAPAGPYKVKASPDAANAALPGDGIGGTGPAPETPGQAAEGRIDPAALPETPARAGAPERAPTDLLPRGAAPDPPPAGAGDATADAPAPAPATAPETDARTGRHRARPAPTVGPATLSPDGGGKPLASPSGGDARRAARTAPTDQTPADRPEKVKKISKPATGRFELPPEDLAKIAPPKPTPTSGALQLGAFSTREKADAAWTAFTAAHPGLALRKRITPLERDGTTLYRLRAAGVADSTKLCATLKAAGEKCLVTR